MMENKFTEIMDELSPEELDQLLDGVEESADEVSSARINKLVKERAFGSGKVKTVRRLPKRAVWAIAACIALVIALGVGTYAYAADVKEYKAAKEFFMENGLSTEGLSRTEIKAVYRDITTESFTYDKTADIVESALLSGTVPGWRLSDSELIDDRPDNEGKVWMLEQTELSGNRYILRTVNEEKDGFTDFAGMVIEKHFGEELIWERGFDGLRIYPVAETDDGVVFGGIWYDEEDESHSRLVKLDPNGDTLWDIEFGAARERVFSLIPKDDGSIAVFSDIDYKGVVLTLVSQNGEVLKRSEHPYSDCYTAKAALRDGGYIGSFDSSKRSELGSFVLADEEGNITNRFRIEMEGELCLVQDVIEYNGRIWLSVYTVPDDAVIDTSDERFKEFYSSHQELQPLIGLIDGGFVDADRPWLTQKIKERYTAMLLIFDPEKNTPEEFYSAGGAIGAELRIDENGNLVWDTQDIRYTRFSPATSAYSFIGYSEVIRYRFESNGNLLEREKTGEYKVFYR